MIRVNLAAQRRAAAPTTGASQTWMLVAMGVVLLEVVALILFHNSKLEELEGHNKTNQKIQAEIDDAKKAVGNHEEIKQKLAACRSRSDAIEKLKTNRFGPTAVLLELSQVLTGGKSPTVDPAIAAQVRRDNPLAAYTPGWDPRRLWLSRYDEKERDVKLEGVARDANDVTELAQRLRASVYFNDVAILPGRKDRVKDLEVVSFGLQVKVRY